MPILSNSEPRLTAGSPRATRDRSHSGRSFLSAGTSLSKSTPSKGPATAFNPVVKAPTPPRPTACRNSRRLVAPQQPSATHCLADEFVSIVISRAWLGGLTRLVNIIARVIAQQLTCVVNIPAHARIGRHTVDHGETERQIGHDAPLH